MNAGTRPGTSTRYFVNTGERRQTTKDLQAEREGFEPPGLIGLPLSRRVHLSALPPFRRPTLPSRRIGERSVQETARAPLTNVGATLQG